VKEVRGFLRRAQVSRIRSTGKGKRCIDVERDGRRFDRQILDVRNTGCDGAHGGGGDKKERWWR
jgi:hypothetical protein